MARLENLLGVQALALVDRMTDNDLAPSESAALITVLAHPGSGVGWLAGVLGLTDSGGTRVVERLVSAGLLQRRPGSDGRSRVLELTDRGRAQAETALSTRERELAQALEPLSDTERQALERLLGKIVTRLADDRLAALHACRLCDREACAAGARCPLEHTVPPGELP